jgi:hypothetical protein
MPLYKMPLVKSFFNPLDRRAALAMTTHPAFSIRGIATPWPVLSQSKGSQ